MRSFLIIASALAAVSSSPGNAASRNFSISGFQKVRVEGPFRIKLQTGVPPFARASGSQAALDRIAFDMRGDTLVIKNGISSWGGYPGTEPGPVTIELGTHELSSAWLTGSGTLAIDKVKGLAFSLSAQGSGAIDIASVRVDQLAVNLIGTATARLAGEATRLTGVVRGVSALQAENLSTENADLTAEGAATLDVKVSDSAKVDAGGPSTVRLLGGPTCTLRVSGSADVSGCGKQR